MSQEELGFRSGLHRTFISLLERGARTPTLDTLFRLAAALDVSPVSVVERLVSEQRRVGTVPGTKSAPERRRPC